MDAFGPCRSPGEPRPGEAVSGVEEKAEGKNPCGATSTSAHRSVQVRRIVLYD
jgi:hypothetical protein